MNLAGNTGIGNKAINIIIPYSNNDLYSILSRAKKKKLNITQINKNFKLSYSCSIIIYKLQPQKYLRTMQPI